MVAGRRPANLSKSMLTCLGKECEKQGINTQIFHELSLRPPRALPKPLTVRSFCNWKRVCSEKKKAPH